MKTQFCSKTAAFSFFPLQPSLIYLKNLEKRNRGFIQRRFRFAASPLTRLGCRVKYFPGLPEHGLFLSAVYRGSEPKARAPFTDCSAHGFTILLNMNFYRQNVSCPFFSTAKRTSPPAFLYTIFPAGCIIQFQKRHTNPV